MDDAMKKYAHILYRERPVTTSKPLSPEQRAAQFMPFSAVVGYEDLVKDSEEQHQKLYSHKPYQTK